MNAIAQVDDEMLLAYLDAQLNDADYPRVEAALAASVPLQKRLQALVDSGEQLRRAYQTKLEEPVPASLIAAIMAAPDPRLALPAQASAKVKGDTAPPRWWRKVSHLLSWAQMPAVWPVTALASVVTLAFGVWVGQGLNLEANVPGGQLALGQPVPHSALATALELAPSGRLLTTPDHQMQVLATFARPSGQVCREFESATRSQSTINTQAGLACRQNGGAWQVAFLVGETTPNLPGEVLYRSASDELHRAIDGYLSATPDLEALPATREQALLSAGWATGAATRP